MDPVPEDPDVKAVAAREPWKKSFPGRGR